MRGSENLVLDVTRRSGSIVLRLHEGGDVVWTGRTDPSNWPEDVPIGNVPLPDLLGRAFFSELSAQLSRYSFVPLRFADDDLALASWGDLLRSARVVDYDDEACDELLRPAELPLGVLSADLDRRFPFDAGRARPMHHFATTALGTVSADRLVETLRRLPHDVVHLRARITQVDGEILLGTPGAGLAGARLRQLLRRRGKMARLVILEIEPEDVDPAIVLARRIRGRGGPTVLVTDEATDFAELYLGIAHSEDLRYAVDATYRGGRERRLPRLVVSDGGAQSLSLYAIARRFRAEADAQSRRVAELQNLIAMGHQRSIDTDTMWSPVLDDLQFGYDAESAGMEPMSDASIELRRVEDALRSVDTQLARVVNTWFADYNGPVPTNRTLGVATNYDVCVSIGAPSALSNIAVSVVVDETLLIDHADDTGVTEVRVVLISDDLEISQDVRMLSVPAAPSSSPTLTFPVVTPSSPGSISARVAVYVDHNLLQSVALSAAVSRHPQHRASANSGQVDWVMTARLDDVDRLGDKAFSVLTNDSGSGTHLVAVDSVNYRSHITLLEGQVTELLRQGRIALQWAAGDPDKDEAYRFAPDNDGDAEQLRVYLSGLAEFGWTMYTTLVTGQADDRLEGQLAESLATPTVIQFARTASSRLMYPWALVYDHPILPDSGNQLCPTFLDAVGRSQPIEQTDCFMRECPHRADANIVCPSGFWGYRHVVEQPLGAIDADDVDALAGRSDLPEVIKVDGSVNTFVGYSTELDPSATHVDQILGLPNVAGWRESARTNVGMSLQDPLELVYFFCHGGSSAGKAWLGVGGTPAEKISPPDLRVWGVSWPVSRPLVFINGCDTVASSPADLATFNEGLRYCKASGVIGTEIQIPVELGREVGESLLGSIVSDRLSVGEAVRKMRIDLLSRFNPLGLAYSPYCLSHLRMIG